MTQFASAFICIPTKKSAEFQYNMTYRINFMTHPSAKVSNDDWLMEEARKRNGKLVNCMYWNKRCERESFQPKKQLLPKATETMQYGWGLIDLGCSSCSSNNKQLHEYAILEFLREINRTCSEALWTDNSWLENFAKDLGGEIVRSSMLTL